MEQHKITVPVVNIASGQIKQTIDSMINKYEFEIRELEDLPEHCTIEDLVHVKSAKVQGLCLDLASDLSILTRFKVDNQGDYYLKFVDPGISYLRELRQLLNLYTVAEKL